LSYIHTIYIYIASREIEPLFNYVQVVDHFEETNVYVDLLLPRDINNTNVLYMSHCVISNVTYN